jgi:ribosomal RNA assembly protein
MTETEISVYGKTVGFIGHLQNIEIAQEAVKMLLNGRSHATVYDYLERNQSQIRR